MIDFTTLPTPTLPQALQVPGVTSSKNNLINALIIVLVLFTIGLIFYGINKNQGNNTRRVLSDKTSK